MRTRLDEIVDEIFDGTTNMSLLMVRGLAHAVATEAFRHGAEQALNSHREFTKTFSVQPEPVEKKKPFDPTSCTMAEWEAFHKEHRDRGEDCWCWKAIGRYKCPHERCQMEHPDRRKGERRKGAEIREGAGLFCVPLVDGYGFREGAGLFSVPLVYRTGVDRRSGKDRRKTKPNTSTGKCG